MITRTPSLSQNHFLLVICLILCFTLILFQADTLYAQAKGMIIGRVVDANSGDFLPGANVMLEGTIMGSSSDREGVFIILNVPDGTYNLIVSYIGYEDYSTEVTVSSSQRKVRLQELPLQISALQADAVVVEGQAEGQMKALNQQRAARNIKSVVAREQMELFPDYTTADAVARLPGVYISRDQGEGRYVLVRGTEPRLSNVKVNGIVGSNQMASIEVVKALTPDMDGDAIGGTVNLITRSPFDYQGRRLRLTAGGGYGQLRGNPLYQGKFSYSDRFGPEKNLGFTVTANWDRTDKGAHGSEKEYGEETDINDNVIPFALQDMDLRDYYNIRDRYGLGGSFEYRPNVDTRFYVNGMWNRFNDDQQRTRKRFRVTRNDYQDPAGTIVDGARIQPEMEARVEELLQAQFAAGGFHQFNQYTLDYKVAYSYAEEQHPEQIESAFRLNGVDMRLDFSDPQFPKFEVTNDVDIYDASLYELNSIDYRETFASDQNMVGAVNFKMPLNFANMATELKFGGKLRIKEKDRDDNRWGYDWEGPDVTMADFPSDRETTDFLNGNYRYGPQADYDAQEKFFKEWRDVPGGLEGDIDRWDSQGQSYKAKENIYAGYGMWTLNLRKTMVLLGGRFESTQNDYTGTLLLFDEDGDFASANDTTGDRTTNFFLPMVHVRYQLTPMTNLRFAVTRTLARPNYFDLVPYLSVDPDGEDIRAGDPDLKTTEAWNFDLMGEHYFLGIGVVSGGFFYKQLDNIIFELRSDEYFGPQSPFYEYDFRGPVNGGKATLYGFELNWQQQLTFLPGLFAGFGIYANYTKTWANSDLIPEAREDVKELPGQAGDVGNLALSYEWGKFSTRLSLFYQDSYMLEVSDDPTGNEDQFRDRHFQVDISAFYKIIPQLDIFAEFVNIGNEPKVEYFGITDRPIQQEYYSWWMRAGLRVSM
jgi:TonB-dependent receptor